MFKKKKTKKKAGEAEKAKRIQKEANAQRIRYSEGYTTGYNAGYTIGYNDGRADEKKESQASGDKSGK